LAWHSKAPLRIGLAGGGTDVSPYCDRFGGAVVNATISLYAHATIELLLEDQIIMQAKDMQEEQVFGLTTQLPIDGRLDLLKAVYNRVQKDFPFPLKGLKLSTFVDAPAGSGLGTSSTLVVAIVGAFREMLQLPLSKSDIARYAWDIERNDLSFSGGRQDQYSATFGGFNYFEFGTDGTVTVTPLLPEDSMISDVAGKLLLYYTDTSRNSADIINEQVKNVISNNQDSIHAMHQLKEQANRMKIALTERDADALGPLLHFGFMHKKNMAANITNAALEAIYSAALNAGASGGKISGAGGGGFMVFYCPGQTRDAVVNALSAYGGTIRPYTFVGEGLQTWTS
jgi:D-glycero-alpha-D-manno-heptose-7-phosphate kinase